MDAFVAVPYSDRPCWLPFVGMAVLPAQGLGLELEVILPPVPRCLPCQSWDTPANSDSDPVPEPLRLPAPPYLCVDNLFVIHPGHNYSGMEGRKRREGSKEEEVLHF